MEIRHYKETEARDLWNLFFNTIHHVNAADYTQEQIDAWAPENIDEQIWQQKIKKINPYVVAIDETIVAYGDIQDDGLIDHFFCHHSYQRIGIGSRLYFFLEKIALEKNIREIRAEASITAKPFFESLGFEVVDKQVLSVRGQTLTNYKMSKNLVPNHQNPD